MACHLLDFYIGSFLPKDLRSQLVIEKREKKDGHLYLSGLAYTSSGGLIKADRIGVYSSIHLFPFSITSYVDVQNPEITITNDGKAQHESAFLGLLFPSKHFAMKLQVEKGVINLPQPAKDPLYFSYSCKDSVGHFRLSQDRNLDTEPLCSVQLSNLEAMMHAKIEVETKDLKVLAPFVSLLCQDKDSYLARLDGQLKASADLVMRDPKHIQNFSFEIDLQNMIAESKDAELSWRVDACRGHFSYPPKLIETLATKLEKNIPFWKKAEGFLSFSNGEFLAKGQKSLGIKKAEGELMLMPDQDPSMKLTAILSSLNSELPIEIYSSGVLHEDGSFWLQSDLAVTSLDGNKAQSTFSLCKVKEDNYVVQTDLQNINSEIFSLASLAGFIPEDIKLKARRLEGSFTAWIDKRHLERLQWKRFVAVDAEIKTPYATSSLEDLSTEGLLIKDAAGWHLEELDVQLQKCTLAKSQLFFSDVNVSLHYHDGVIQPSALAAFWNKGKLTLSVYGPIHDLVSKVEIDSSWNALVSMLYPSISRVSDCHSTTKLDISLKNSIATMQGDTQFVLEGEEESRLHMSLEFPILGKGAVWHRKIAFADFKGVLHSDLLKCAVFLPLLSLADKDLSFSGAVSLDATLAHAKVKGRVTSPDLFLGKGGIALSTGEIGLSTPALFTYDFSSSALSAELELVDGFFADKSGIALDSVSGRFLWQDHRLKAESLQAVCEGIVIPFSLYFDAAGLFVETAPLQGKVEEICKVDFIKKALGPSSTKMTGLFSMPAGGCNILVQKTDKDWIWHWKVAAGFSEVCSEITPEVKIVGAQCDLFFDSSSMVSSIKKTKGKLALCSGSYAFTLDDFSFDPRKDNSFDLKVVEGKTSFLALSGIVRLSQDVELVFDKDKTEFLSIPLQISKCIMSKDLKIKEIDFTLPLSASALRDCLDKAKNIQAVPVKAATFIEEKLSSLQGDLCAHVTFTENAKWRMHLQSPKLIWKESTLQSCEVVALYKAPLITIEKMLWNKSSLQTSASLQDKTLKISYVKYASPDAKIDLQGCYSLESRKLDVPRMNFSIASTLIGKDIAKYLKGSLQGLASLSCLFDQDMNLVNAKADTSLSSKLFFPFICDVKNRETVSVNYDKDSGLQVKRLDLTAFASSTDEVLARVSLDSLKYVPKEERVCLNNCLLLLVPAGTEAFSSSGLLSSDVCRMKKDLDWQMSGDVTLSKAGIEALLSLKPGLYSAGGNDYTLLDPRLQISSTSLHLRSRLQLGTPIICDLQKEFAKDSPLYVLLRANPEAEGLKILCKEKNGNFDPQRIEGKLMGLEANLQKSAHISDGSFFGFVKLDFVQAEPLLSKQMKEIVNSLKLGSGYTLQGHFTLPETEKDDFGFQGDIKAEKCQFLGYTFQTLSVKAQISPSKVTLDDIKIDDMAGQLSVKTCEIDKDPFTSKWSLAMPLGHIREFRPSLLMENGKRGAEKPFLLKNLSVYDFKGQLGDSKSFTGSGALQFLNSNKKEFSFFDIPFEMLKDLGLDTGILTPISGEADFSIRKGRCVFNELKNSYSEGRRSEFFLSGDTPAYIDFEGNWHVDLKMKQHVLLKWSESLLVSIRGKIDKPKYSLKNVDDPL